MAKMKVTRHELAEIIARELASVDVSPGHVRPGPFDADILGDGEDWFMRFVPAGQIKSVIDDLRRQYVLVE